MGRGNALNPPTYKKPMQPGKPLVTHEQATLDLGLESQEKLAWAMDVIRVYNWRTDQHNAQLEPGRYSQTEWLEAIYTVAQQQGPARAMDEVTTTLSILSQTEATTIQGSFVRDEFASHLHKHAAVAIRSAIMGARWTAPNPYYCLPLP